MAQQQKRLGVLVSSLEKNATKKMKKNRNKGFESPAALGVAAAIVGALGLAGFGTYLYLNQTTTKPRRTRGPVEGNTNALKNVI